MNEYEPNKWRKRPVEITAQRMPEPFEVETLEGTMRGKKGDWLITGIKGEQYPCDDDIFRSSYESEEASEDKSDCIPIEREDVRLLLALAGEVETLLRTNDTSATRRSMFLRGHAADQLRAFIEKMRKQGVEF